MKAYATCNEKEDSAGLELDSGIPVPQCFETLGLELSSPTLQPQLARCKERSFCRSLATSEGFSGA